MLEYEVGQVGLSDGEFQDGPAQVDLIFRLKHHAALAAMNRQAQAVANDP